MMIMKHTAVLLADSVRTLAMTRAGQMLTASMSEDELKTFFSNEGAAAEGGALEGVGNMVTEMGGGIFNIGQDALLYIAGTVILIIAGGLMLHGKNVNKRAEIKDGLGWQFIGAVLGFGVLGALMFIMGIGSTFFS